MHSLYAIMSGRVTRKTWALTDGVHGMGRKLEDAIEHEGAALKEAVAPIPTIICNYAVRL
jgi:hypothetical protein